MSNNLRIAGMIECILRMNCILDILESDLVRCTFVVHGSWCHRHSMHIRCIISINRTKPPQGESVTVFVTTGMSILVYYIPPPPPPPKTVVVYLHLWRGLGKLIPFLPLGVALSFFFSFLLLCLGWFASGLPWIPPNSSHAREH